MKPGTEKIYIVVNFVAILLGRAWIATGLPPHGEATLAVGFYAVIAQWLLFGLIAGAVWFRYGKSRINAA